MRHSLIIAAVLVLLAAVPAVSQPVWSLEIVGGLNLSKLAGDDTNARVVLGTDEISGNIDGTRAGFAAGVLLDAFFNDNLGVRSGLLWARKGADGEVRFQGDIPGIGPADLTADITLTLDYVEWPILCVVAFPISDGARVRMMAGPVFAFNSNADIGLSLAGFSDSQDIKDQIKSVDIEGLLGVGVMIPVGAVDIVVDGSYSRGFSKIDDTIADLDLKNSEFRLLAGVSLPIGAR